MIRITDKQLETLLADRRFNVTDPHEVWESCPDCQIRYALLELSALRAKAKRHLRLVATDETSADSASREYPELQSERS
jgi:hypothetical protein